MSAFGGGPPDPDAIAAGVSRAMGITPGDSRAFQIHQEVRLKRAEAHDATEAAEHRMSTLAARLAVGGVAEEVVVAAVEAWQAAQRREHAWNLAFDAAKDHPAIVGRR